MKRDFKFLWPLDKFCYFALHDINNLVSFIQVSVFIFVNLNNVNNLVQPLVNMEE